MLPRAVLPLAVLLVFAAPSPAFANGFNYLVSSMRWSAAGAVVGCVFGLIAALANEVPSSRRAVWVFVTSLCMGLVGGCVGTMGSGRPFDVIGFLPPIIVIAAGVGFAGGLATAAFTSIVESKRCDRSTDDDGPADGPTTPEGP